MKKFNTGARLTELDELSDLLIQLYGNETALNTEAYLKPLFAEMTDVSNKITEAIRKDKAYSDLEDADIARDAAARKLFKITEGYAAVPISAVSEPAVRIQMILQKFTGLTRQAYNEETSLIESLLSDLSAPEAAADTAQLQGLPESISALRQAQSDFMAKRVQYSTATSEQKYGETASAFKKPLLKLINDRLVPYLTLMKEQDADKYGHFADAVQNAVDAANTKIISRSRKAEKPEPKT